MSSTRSFGLPWTTVNCCSTAAVFIPATQWVDPANFAKAKATFEVQAICGNLTILPAYQVADVQTVPGPGVPLSTSPTFIDTSGVEFPDAWLLFGPSVQTKQSIRFGWLVKNSTGAALSAARVGGQIQIVTC